MKEVEGEARVLKMLTVMSENGNGERDPVQDFLTTGRAGRRNALPNILSDHAMTTTADLPERLMGLTTTEKKEGNEESTTCDEPKDDDGSEASGSSSS
nr:cAMP-dependent protein kinase inhibitor beta-like isoform X2 [Halyomorpha halys]